MSWVLLLGLLLVIVLVLALKAKSGEGTSRINFPYQPAKVLFSAAERSFLSVLDQAVGPDHRVFGKVRLADLAAVKAGLGHSARQGALNRIAGKHLDYVVCRSSDLAVPCAVELNDKSHATQRAQARDDLLVNVCRVINLPLLQVVAKSAYSIQDVRAQFLAGISPAAPAANKGEAK